MCGEIQTNQYKQLVNVRLTTTGAEQTVLLNKQLINVEEIRLSEVLAVGWNGGVSTGAYLDIQGAQLNSVSFSDNNRPGSLVLVDINNPHTVYANKLLAVSQLGTVNSFRVSLSLATGVPILFTELWLVLTFVCRNPVDGSAAARAFTSALDIPQMKGPDPRQTFL